MCAVYFKIYSLSIKGDIILDLLQVDEYYMNVVVSYLLNACTQKLGWADYAVQA